MPGIAATALICFIFAWNEFFLAREPPTVRGATVAGLPRRLHHQRGPVPGACSPPRRRSPRLPVLAAGWVAQDKLVRGLSHGRGQVTMSATSALADTLATSPARCRAPATTAPRVDVGHRPLRRRRLPPRAPGDVPRPADERRARRSTGASAASACCRPTGAMQRRAARAGRPLHARREARRTARCDAARHRRRSPSTCLAPDDPEAVIERMADAVDADRLADRSPRAATTSTMSPASSTPTTRPSSPTCSRGRRRRRRSASSSRRWAAGARAGSRRSPSCPATTCRATASWRGMAFSAFAGSARPGARRLGRARGARSPTRWSTASRPVTTDDDRRRGARAVRHRGRAGPSSASPSPSGCSRTRSRSAGRRTRTPASSSSTTSSPTS